MDYHGSSRCNGYFRGSFSLPNVPAKAYLIVSATENLEAFVNDEKVGQLELVQNRPTGILDVVANLRPGENLIALKVDTQCEHVAPAIRARLVTEARGSISEINSDTGWAATGLPVKPAGSSVEWNSPDYIDTQWPDATVAKPDSMPVQPPAAPEYLYQTFPNGNWIWDDDHADTETLFSRTFFLDGSEIVDAWLGIGVSGQYFVTVNGMPLYSYRGVANSQPVMDTFNIGPLLRIGENRLLVNVEGESPGPRLLASGLVFTDTTRTVLSSDGHWSVVRDHQPDHPVAAKPFVHGSDSM